MASAVVTVLIGATSPSYGAVCGNGIKESGEECDSTDFCCNPDCTRKPTGTDCDDNPYDCNPKRCDTNGFCDAKVHELDGNNCVAPGGGDACHQGTCNNGSCIGTGIDPCNASPSTACKVCALHPENGPPPTSAFACDGGNKTDGTMCNADSLACTIDVCVSGTCPVGPPKTCSPTGNECTENVCTEPSGDCSTRNKTTGTACSDDFNVCTKDICRAGSCRHEDPDGDLNGTGCNDGRPCTKTDQCSYGVCVGFANVTAGTFCTNGNPCINPGTCNGSGQCIMGSYVAANTPCDDHRSCTTGTKCNGTGVCMNGTNVANGTACDDFNGCTGDGTCTNGSCTGATPANAGGVCYNTGPDVGPPYNPNYRDEFCQPGVCNTVGVCIPGSSQTTGSCQDFNTCTDASTTVCNEAAQCVPHCFSDPQNHICAPCNSTCGSNPTGQDANGASIPCSCISFH